MLDTIHDNYQTDVSFPRPGQAHAVRQFHLGRGSQLSLYLRKHAASGEDLESMSRNVNNVVFLTGQSRDLIGLLV